MKKIISLLIVLILVLSLFTVTAVAFADETTAGDSAGGAGDATAPDDGENEPEEPAHPEIIFHEDVFNQLDVVKNLKKLQSMNSSFQLDNEWTLVDDAAWQKAHDEDPNTNLIKVSDIFENINYQLNPESSSNKYAVISGSDKIYWEYCSPSKEYKDKWVRSELRSTINASSTGWWGFRYVVTDKDGSTSTSDTAEEHVLFRTPAFFVYIADNTRPVITKLHSDMVKAMEEGIKVGSSYTIKTNLSITDTSSTTTTYKVYKRINGQYDLTDPIYDSATKEVKEGFEDCISTSGVITMLASDVVTSGEKDMYKIIYTVTDALGYSVSTLGTEWELTLFAVPEDKTLDAAQIWQIVLYVIAGLSAVGIVVVLCIKPKEPVPEGRTAPKKVEKAEKVAKPAKAAPAKASNVVADTSSKDAPVEEPVEEEPVVEESVEEAEEVADVPQEDSAENPEE